MGRPLPVWDAKTRFTKSYEFKPERVCQELLLKGEKDGRAKKDMQQFSDSLKRKKNTRKQQVIQWNVTDISDISSPVWTAGSAGLQMVTSNCVEVCGFPPTAAAAPHFSAEISARPLLNVAAVRLHTLPHLLLYIVTPRKYISAGFPAFKPIKTTPHRSG